MTAGEAYWVRYFGRRQEHRMRFAGPDAEEQAIRYAKERGGSAQVTFVRDGEPAVKVWPIWERNPTNA